MGNSKMLVGSIDLKKIDKTKIVTTDKNGQPFANGAKYYNIVVWVNDEVDQYGHIASIQESLTKEERESGLKGNYIGNLDNIPGQNTSENKHKTNENTTEAEDDLPF